MDPGDRAPDFQFLVRDKAGQVTGAFGAVPSGAWAEVVKIPPAEPAGERLCGKVRTHRPDRGHRPDAHLRRAGPGRRWPSRARLPRLPLCASPGAEGRPYPVPHPGQVVGTEHEDVRLPARHGGCRRPEVSLPPSDVQPAGLPTGRPDTLYHSALSVPRANTTAWLATTAMPGVLLVTPPKSMKPKICIPAGPYSQTWWLVPVTATTRVPIGATAAGPVPGSSTPPSDRHPVGARPGRRRPGTQPGTRSRHRRRPPGSRRVAARHRLRPRPGRDGLPPPRRRPVPARRPAPRHAVPAGRPPLLRPHRSRRTRTRRRPEPGVRARAAGAVQRADLLRHDDQPGRRARAGRKAARRDTAALRPRAPGSRSIQRATPIILRAVEQVHDRAARSG